MLVLVAGTVALLYTWVTSSTPQSTAAYSTFYDDVKAGKVQTVSQDGETLTVTPKTGSPYTVVVPNSITGDVYSDMQKASLAGSQDTAPTYTKKATADTSWIGLLLTGLLPLIVIGGFIFFMMRQAQGTNNQALSFGKSRARMFLGNKTVVTFADVAGRRRGEDGAPGGRGVPQVPGEVQLARRAHPARRAARGPSGHRQDADGSRRRGRGRGAVLQHLGLRVRRDVRGRRREPRARPVRPGEAQQPVHRVRGRDRRGRPPARRRPRRLARRARADPQPDPGRDGRLRHQHQRDRRRRHQPARRPRPGAPAARPLRPPGHPRPPGHEGPPRDPQGPHQGQAPRQGHLGRRGRAPVARLLRRGPREPRQRGRDPRRAAQQEGHRDERVLRGPRAHRRRPGAQEPRHLATRRSGSSPTTRAVTPSCSGSCRSATRSRRSPSSAAAWPSATRWPCRPRTATSRARPSSRTRSPACSAATSPSAWSSATRRPAPATTSRRPPTSRAGW